MNPWLSLFALAAIPLAFADKIGVGPNQLQFNARKSVCMTAGFGNGSPVVAGPCNTSVKDDVIWFANFDGAAPGGGTGPKTSLVHYGDFCLEVPNGKNADGTKLLINECDGSKNQEFHVNGNLTISWSNSGRCLDLTKGDTTTGTPIQLWACGSGSGASHRQWFPKNLPDH